MSAYGSQTVTDLTPSPDDITWDANGAHINGIEINPEQKELVSIKMLEQRVKQGWTARRIATHWGCKHPTVLNWIKPFLKAESNLLSEEYKEMMIANLEEIIEAHMIKVKDSRSADVIMKAQDRIAKLKGLDAPVKVEHSGYIETPQEREDRLILEQWQRDEKMKEEDKVDDGFNTKLQFRD